MSDLIKICNTTGNLNSSFILMTEGIHIWHNDCLTTQVSDLRSMPLDSKFKVKYTLKDFKNAKNENFNFLHPEHFCLL